MTKTLTIAAVALPETFPPHLVPNNEHQFMHSLIGKPLVEAIAEAAQRGLQPRTHDLSHVHPHAVGFAVSVGGMTVPWVFLMGDAAVTRKVH